MQIDWDKIVELYLKTVKEIDHLSEQRDKLLQLINKSGEGSQILHDHLLERSLSRSSL